MASRQQDRDDIEDLIRRQQQPDDEPLDLKEWDAGLDNDPIPPRGWLLGNLLCRQFLSSIFGTGEVGKTAVMIVLALCLATGRALIGEHVFQRCKVLLVCFEDGRDELRRRVAAAMLHHRVSKTEVRDHLFLSAVSRRDAKFASLKYGELKGGKLGDALETSIRRHGIDAVFLDPFVKTHAVDENDNSLIDEVAGILVDIITRHDCAGFLPHHIRKGSPEPGNAEIGRGASALKDAVRLGYTLTRMSDFEGDEMGVEASQRPRLIRLDHGKVNLVRRNNAARWYKLVSVAIGNPSELYPNGDEIQTIECWDAPPATPGLTTAIAETIIAEIHAGMPKDRRYSSVANVTTRAAFRIVLKHCPEIRESAARGLVKSWVDNRVLDERPYYDPVDRKDVLGLFWTGKRLG